MTAVLDMSDPGELVRAGQALAHHVEEARASRAQAISRAQQVQRRVDEAVLRLENAAGAARQRAQLSAHERNPDTQDAQSALRTAEANLDEGRRLQRVLHSAVEAMTRDSGSYLRSVETSATRSMNVLSRFYDEVMGIRGAFSTALEKGGTSAPVAGSPPGTTPAGTATRVGGGEVVELAQIDTADSTVTGPADFVKVDFETVCLGLRCLVEEVMPRVARGASADDFRRMDDERRAAGGTVKYSAVYQSFYGDSSIKLARRADGRFEVENGYHRLWAARKLGITHLPAVTHG